MNRIKYKIVLIILFSTIGVAYSQIKEERVRAKRTQQPDTKKIVKKGQIAEEPNKTEIKNDTLNYTIEDVEAVSDFKTSQLPPQEIQNLPKEKIYDNYAKAAYGNFDHLLLQVFYTHKLNEKMNVGGKFTHNSSTGLKNDFPWNSDDALNDIEVFLNSNLEKGKLNIVANYNFKKVNYYGIQTLIIPPFNNDSNLQQKYNMISVKGNYDAFSNKYFDKANIKTGYFWDAFNSKESFVEGDIYSDISDIETELPLVGEIDFGIETEAKLKLTHTEFSEISPLKTSYFTSSITPILKFEGEKFNLKIGGGITYNVESESGNSDIYFHPRANIEYLFGSKITLFGGIEGGLQQNSYADISTQNPFVAPLLTIVPTNTKYNIFSGIKGELGVNFKYTVQGNYSNVENILFFQKPIFNSIFGLNNNAYNHLNSFSTLYDDGKILGVSGQLNYIAIEKLNVQLNAKFENYQLDNLSKAYYKPTITSDISASFLMLKDKLIVSSKLYFVGERKANDYIKSNANAIIIDQNDVVNSEITLKSYVDFNLSLSYKIKPYLSIFVNGINLLNSDYQRYTKYTVQGTQVLGGVLFKF